jgi:hypothetical protein
MRFHEQIELPKLAWVASHNLSSGETIVYHGSAVERGNDWLVEGVWDGEFPSADFHKSAHFFGSGIRMDDNAVHFVTSAALVDRLIYYFCHGKLVVSNSLVAIMAFTGARLDPHHDYRTESFTILEGLKKYNREYCIIHPEIKCFYQIYSQNILVKNGEISFYVKLKKSSIDSFDTYLTLITQTLDRIRRNSQSKERKFGITGFTTMSSGYDSTAVSCLARKIGVQKCFTSHKSNSILPTWLSPNAAVDDGGSAAKILGYDVQYMNSNNPSEDELFFLGASCAGPELIYYSLSRHISNSGQVGLLFTGYHGDVIWDTKLKPKETGDDLIRGDTSGFNLSEIRLNSGFIHVAVPFLFACNIKEILKITLSESMHQWRLFNDYDRPIARRIVESSGIPRTSFGFRKKGVTKYYNYPRNITLRRQYFDFLKREHGISSFYVYAYDALINYPTIILMGIFYKLGLGKLIDKNWRSGLGFSRKMFVWAANLLTDTMAGKLNWPQRR